MNYLTIGIIILGVFLLGAIIMLFFQRTRNVAKTIGGIAGATLLVFAGGGAVFVADDGGLHDTAVLVSNTEQCIGTYCEAVFALQGIDTPNNKTLARNLNLFITFEDQQAQLKSTSFNVDFEVFHYELANVTREERVYSHNATNGTNESSYEVYALTNITVVEPVRANTGKKAVFGPEVLNKTQYVRIYTNDFNEEWVDWHVLIKNWPVTIAGVSTQKDFDTHKKGWAVWASGGAETSVIYAGTNYTVHTFTTNGTFSVNDSRITSVELLVVAGGGSGGAMIGGGGGAGGLIYNSSYPVSYLSNYTVVVGVGGAGLSYGLTQGITGQNSSFGSVAARGGGGGGRYDTGTGVGTVGSAGGSGGGGGTGNAGTYAGGAGTTSQGNNGGTGQGGAGLWIAGGGGGASAVGNNYNTAGATGKGGAGTTYNITGTPTNYSCGGGAGAHGAGGVAGDGGCASAGAGAISGGATGGTGTNAGGAAADNRGGGGGGAAYTSGSSGAGGSGIVVVRYATPIDSPSCVLNWTSTFTNITANHNITTNRTIVAAPENSSVCVMSASAPYGTNATFLDSTHTFNDISNSTSAAQARIISEGKYGVAMNFSGRGNYTLPDMFAQNDNRSVMGWFRINQDGTNAFDSNEMLRLGQVYLHSRNSVNDFTWRVDNGTASTVSVVLGAGNREWQYFCGNYWYNGSAWCINGTMNGTRSMGANQCKTNVISGTGLAIGARGSTAFSNTSIDNLMIFNRTTTVEECSANMNVSIPVAATDAMIAFYPGEAYNSTHVFDQDYLFANNSWFDNRTGAWSVGPDISKTGVYSVNFTAQSNTSTNISQVITINITNTAPTASIPVISCTTAYNNAACTLYAKASDPDGDSVNIQWNVTRNGTIVSSGVNSSVPSGTNLTLGGFTAAEGYVYQLNTSSTDTLLSSTKVAYTTEQFLSLPGAVLCPSILALQWNSNLSRGVYNASSKRYSEAFILPVNNTGCAWTYKLNNSNTGLSLTYTFSTNVTHANYTMLVNGTLINASSSKAIVVPNNAVYYVNWSMNLTNWYVLHAAPSANNTVSVSI